MTNGDDYGMGYYEEMYGAADERLPCTIGCVVNSLVGGDHAYCACHCHVGTLPAEPPSRTRQEIPQQ